MGFRVFGPISGRFHQNAPFWHATKTRFTKNTVCATPEKGEEWDFVFFGPISGDPPKPILELVSSYFNLMFWGFRGLWLVPNVIKLISTVPDSDPQRAYHLPHPPKFTQ